MQAKLRGIVKGALTLVPGVSSLANRSTGGTVSSRYCYSVWMRHLCSVAQVSAMRRPQCIAELGPGDSIGIGLAAMLSGADRYYALDRKAFATLQGNLRVFEELLELFLGRAPVPGDDEFPDVYPKLRSYEFPHAVLDDQWLRRSLDPARVEQIGCCLRGQAPSSSAVEIRYFAPWDDSAQVRPQSVDWIVSQAVLEHVDDIAGTYANLAKWLQPHGVMSHAIDFSSHGLARDWYGHWTVSPPMWKVIRGRRAYLINRLPHSAHIDEMRRSGLRILHDECIQGQALPRAGLARGLETFADEDLSTSSAFVVVDKGAAAS